MNIPYLKPRFSHHPLNYIALLVVFLTGFFGASVVVAFEDDGTFSSGYYYAMKYSPYAAGPTVTEMCLQGGSTFGMSGGKCLRHGSSEMPYNKLSCFSNIQWYCTQEPAVPNNCPEQGTVRKVIRPINAEIFTDGEGNDHIIPVDENGNTEINIGGSGVFEGCDFYVPTGEEAQQLNLPDRRYRCAGEDYCYAIDFMVATGEAAPEGTENTGQSIESTVADALNGETDDNRKNTEDVVVEEPVITTGADGSTTKLEKQTVTSVNGAGQKVTESTETVTITDTKGIQRVTTTTVNTVTFPDGSTEVTTDVMRSYTQTPVTTYTIDKSTGTTTVTATPASSSSGSSRTTETYDPDGNLTGSNTTETTNPGTGEGEGSEDGSEDGECDSSQEECGDDLEFEEPEKGGFEDGAATAELNAAKAELAALVDDIKGQINDQLSLSLSGSVGSLNDSELQWGDIQVSTSNNLQRWFDILDIDTLVMLIAALASFIIIFSRG